MKIASMLAVPASMLVCTGLCAADDDVRPDEALQLIEAGTILSFEELNERVLELHPDTTIEDAELERERDRYVYQVELSGPARADEWDVELDAATGEVLSDHRDN